MLLPITARGYGATMHKVNFTQQQTAMIVGLRPLDYRLVCGGFSELDDPIHVLLMHEGEKRKARSQLQTAEGGGTRRNTRSKGLVSKIAPGAEQLRGRVSRVIGSFLDICHTHTAPRVSLPSYPPSR